MILHVTYSSCWQVLASNSHKTINTNVYLQGAIVWFHGVIHIYPYCNEPSKTYYNLFATTCTLWLCHNNHKRDRLIPKPCLSKCTWNLNGSLSTKPQQRIAILYSKISAQMVKWSGRLLSPQRFQSPKNTCPTPPAATAQWALHFCPSALRSCSWGTEPRLWAATPPTIFRDAFPTPWYGWECLEL